MMPLLVWSREQLVATIAMSHSLCITRTVSYSTSSINKDCGNGPVRCSIMGYSGGCGTGMASGC